MALSTFAAQGADQIYQSGPESLALESWAILAGSISHYSKQVTTVSQGAEPIPMTWTVSGQLTRPINLKGPAAAAPVSFSKEERSRLVPSDPSIPVWQLSYDEIAPSDLAVLFFRGDPAKPSITVLPSRANSHDLVALLREIIPIQAIQDSAQQTAAWLQCLEQSRSEEGRKSSLRSLVRANTPWPKLAHALEHVMAEPVSSPNMRTFVFGIVAFAVMKESFASDQLQAVDFLCREFVAEQNPRTALQFILNLKLLLRFTGQKEGRNARLPLEQRIIGALKRRLSIGRIPPELEEQYRQIQAAHPGTL
jgi:hypothetical protein